MQRSNSWKRFAADPRLALEMRGAPFIEPERHELIIGGDEEVLRRKGSCVMSQARVTYPTLSRDQVIERLRESRVNLEKKLPISKMILYGSYAENRYTAGSDIDVVIVYEGKERADAYKLVMEEMSLPRLEPKVYTREQFSALIAQSPKFAETLGEKGTAID